jgi:hypothetical protein
MSDFEDRLRDALGVGAADAPDAVGLADAARSRARNRRRTTTAVSALAVLALVAVPAAVVALRDSGDSRAGVADEPTDSPTLRVPDGWRTETWRDLEIQVPDEWGYGALSTWCTDGDVPGRPVVERPGVVESIDCAHPQNGYGVQFFDASLFDPKLGPGEVAQQEDNPSAGLMYPNGAWIGFQGDGRNAVRVVARTKSLAREILESVGTLEGVDSNGCAVKVSPRGSYGDAMSICRYAPDGWLEQSERLTSDETGEALAALADSPLDGRRGPPCTRHGKGTTVVMATRDRYAIVRFGWECWSNNRVRTDGQSRMLNERVMYWALSPGWSGSVDESVPLPPALRH